jgi:hypothetical protein
MVTHPALHAAYTRRHAHKAQLLSSWARASVEHCMRVELYHLRNTLIWTGIPDCLRFTCIYLRF